MIQYGFILIGQIIKMGMEHIHILVIKIVMGDIGKLLKKKSRKDLKKKLKNLLK